MTRIWPGLLGMAQAVQPETILRWHRQGFKFRMRAWHLKIETTRRRSRPLICVWFRPLTFDRLFAFLVPGHGRRQLLWIEVTRHPTAGWLVRQITEAFPWTSAPAIWCGTMTVPMGHVFTSRVRVMGIRDRPISPGSPWQNGYAERLIGTLRRECLDRMLVITLRPCRNRRKNTSWFGSLLWRIITLNELVGWKVS